MAKKNTVELPDVTIEKLIKNTCDVDINEIEEPVKEDEYNEADKSVDENDDINNVDNTDDEEVKEVTVEYNDVDFKSRGFKTLEDAINFLSTPRFENLGEADKEEFKQWLIK